MLTKQLALVSLTDKLTATELSQTAAALQKQITRDLAPIWNIQATIDYFPDLKSVPVGYWPIIIAENIHAAGAPGFHTDKHHQPFSLVELNESWQLTCSHESCEMLVDPSGNKLAFAQSLKPEQGKVKYLVEVCDPCEDASFAYSINGILVSDFYTPNYFDPQPVAGVRYSYTGAITKPLDIKKNGYLSWQDPVSKQWYQATFFGSSLVIKPLIGMKDFGQNLRSQVDRLTRNPNHTKGFKAAAKKHFALQAQIFKSGVSMSDDIGEEITKFINSDKGKSMHLLSEESATQTVNLTVTFFSGNAADTLLATLVRLEDGSKEIQSVDFNGGTLTFNNVSPEDTIRLDGFCITKAVITIDVPVKQNLPSSFPGGNIFFTLIIK